MVVAYFLGHPVYKQSDNYLNRFNTCRVKNLVHFSASVYLVDHYGIKNIVLEYLHSLKPKFHLA